MPVQPGRGREGRGGGCKSYLFGGEEYLWFRGSQWHELGSFYEGGGCGDIKLGGTTSLCRRRVVDLSLGGETKRCMRHRNSSTELRFLDFRSPPNLPLLCCHTHIAETELPFLPPPSLPFYKYAGLSSSPCPDHPASQTFRGSCLHVPHVTRLSS